MFPSEVVILLKTAFALNSRPIKHIAAGLEILLTRLAVSSNKDRASRANGANGVSSGVSMILSWYSITPTYTVKARDQGPAQFRFEGAQFWVACPDNEATEDMDRERMFWGVGDIVNGRPFLSRWRQ
jgi:hypothetical protein